MLTLTLKKAHHMKNIILAAPLLAAVFAVPVTAQADSWNGYHGNNYNRGDQAIIWSKDRHDHDDRWDERRYYNSYFRDADRRAYYDYYHNRYTKKCPPGLAKKHNGCIPPGHARYVIGQPLPSNVRYVAVPANVSARFQSPPPGYRYVMVDNDALLVNNTNMNVVDAISLFAMMNSR